MRWRSCRKCYLSGPGQSGSKIVAWFCGIGGMRKFFSNLSIFDSRFVCFFFSFREACDAFTSDVFRLAVSRSFRARSMGRARRERTDDRDGVRVRGPGRSRADSWFVFNCFVFFELVEFSQRVVVECQSGQRFKERQTEFFLSEMCVKKKPVNFSHATQRLPN